MVMRLLILYAAVHGRGHKSAGDALATALRKRSDVDVVRSEDALDYGVPLYKKLYGLFYRELSENLPAIWERIYDASDGDDESFLNSLRLLLDRLGVRELDDLIEEFKPDAVICTHFLPLNILSWYRQKQKMSVPVYGVVTDYAGHLYWVADEVDGYFVPSTTAKTMLESRGVPRHRISVTGIPVDPALPQAEDAAHLCERHGIERQPVITFVCSAMDGDRVRTVVEGVKKTVSSGTFIVVPGRNSDAEEATRGLERSSGLETRILSGFVDYLEELIAASDLVITKAGGLIVSEIIAQGVPLLLLDPLRGQEEWNADYIVGTGAGVQTRVADMVPGVIGSLIQDPQRLELMKRRADEAGTPDAASRIAELIVTGAGQSG